MELRHLLYFLAVGEALNFTKAATPPLVALRRHDYSKFYRILDRMFALTRVRSCIGLERDNSTSLITELEIGKGVEMVSELFKHIAGKRLVCRPLSNSQEFQSVGIARATRDDVAPAGEEFSEYHES